MGLLDSLGLLGVFGGGQAQYNPFQNQQPMAGNYPIYIQHSCIHYNCPICKEEVDNKAKLWKEEQDKITLKKQDYKRRCVEYMKRFRKVNNA